MKRYQQLLQERADLVKEAQGIFALAEQEKRDLTDAEKARDDAINARLQTLAGEIEREERRREWERTVEAVPDANMQAARRGVESVRDRREDDPKRGFSDLGDFALAVKSYYSPGGRRDDRLLIGAAPTDFHRESGGDEGLMVPPAFKAEIFEVVMESDDSLLAAVDSEPTSGDRTSITKDESTPWGATGVQANWRAEGVQMTPSKLLTSGVDVRCWELYAFVLATGELLQDAARLADRLTRKAGLAIRYKVNEAIVNGTGAGQPLGWFTHSAKVSVVKETSQTAATVNAQNVSKMYARNLNPARANWYINQDVFPQLPLMTIGNQPIWLAPNGFMSAPGGLLLGRPVIFLENCQTVGTQGDIQFVDPKGYYANHKGSAPAFASSIHLYFDYNIEAFRWIFRVGGQPYLSAVVSPAKGTSTRAHVVVLDTRA